MGVCAGIDMKQPDLSDPEIIEVWQGRVRRFHRFQRTALLAATGVTLFSGGLMVLSFTASGTVRDVARATAGFLTGTTLFALVSVSRTVGRMLRCPRCGALRQVNAETCDSCLATLARSGPPDKPFSNGSLLRWLELVLLFIFAYFVYSARHNSGTQ